MFPGLTTKLSEDTLVTSTTIRPKADLIRLTSTTTISTIVPYFGGGFSGILFLVPTSGAVALNTAGNILNAVTMANNQPCVLVFSKRIGKWYAGAIS